MHVNVFQMIFHLNVYLTCQTVPNEKSENLCFGEVFCSFRLTLLFKLSEVFQILKLK